MPGDANQRDTEEAAATSTSPPGETIRVTAIHLRNPGCPAEALCSLPLCAGMRGAEIRRNPLFDSADPKSLENLSADLRGQVTFGSVRATSAIDPSMLWFTGVAIKAWMLPASGPL